jgi:methylitaconate Delta-isomerase
MKQFLGDQIPIFCSLYRGGTSKAVFFLKQDLPEREEDRARLLLKIMGSPDPRQIDGLGGADPLTSRVGIVNRDASGIIHFQFALVHIKEPIVEFHGFCGNTLAAVGPFAINEGLVEAEEPMSRVTIWDANTNMHLLAEVLTLKGGARAKGDCHIDGVPHSGSPITLRLLRPTSMTGRLLPTGSLCDILETSFGSIEASLIDCVDPVVFVKAEAIALRGDETAAQLDKDEEVLNKLEELRQMGAKKMQMACSGYLPKIVFVALGPRPGEVVARMLSLGKMHKAYAVSCGFCTAVAAQLPGTLVNRMSHSTMHQNRIVIHHPLGQMEVGIKVSPSDPFSIEELSVLRTARCLMRGQVFIPK